MAEKSMVAKLILDASTYKQGIDLAKQATLSINKELELWKTQNRAVAGSAQTLAKELEAQKAQQSMLSAQIDITKKKLQEVSDVKGIDSRESATLKNKLLDLQIAQAKLSQEIEKASGPLRNYEKDMQKLDQQMQINAKEMQLWTLHNNVGQNSLRMLSKEAKENAVTQKILTSEISMTKAKLVEVTAAEGADSAAAMKLKNDLLNLQIQQAKLNKEIGGGLTPLQNFKNNIKVASDELQKAGEKMMSVGRGMSTYITAPVLAAGAAIMKMALSAGEYGDNLDVLSIKTGMSLKQLQEWRYASTQVDYDFNTLQTTISQFTNKIRGATDGTGDTAKAFKVLQMTMDDGKGGIKSINDLFMESIDKLSRIDNITIKNTLSSALFGRSFAEILPLLNAGTNELKMLFEEANKGGYVLGDQMVENLDKLMHRWDALKLRFQIVGAEIGGKFLPIIEYELIPFIENKLIPGIEKFALYIGELVKKFMELDPKVQQNILLFGGLAIALGPALTALGGITTALGGIIGLLGKIPGVAAVAAASLKWAVPGLIAGGIYAGAEAIANSKQYKDAMVERLEKNEVIMLGQGRHISSGTPEYEKFKQDYYKQIGYNPAGTTPAENTKSDASKYLYKGSDYERAKQQYMDMAGYKSKIAQQTAQVEKEAAQVEKQAAIITKESQKQSDEYNKKVSELFKNLMGGSDDASKKIDKFKDSIKSLVDAMKSQTSAFANFAGLFDIFKREPISSERLMNRLKAQVKAMLEWRNSLAVLQKKGVGEEFLADLRAMGPSAVDSINALAKMTKEQLKQYTGLYSQKYTIAGSEASKLISANQTSQTKIEKQINMTINSIKFENDEDADKVAGIVIKKLRIAGYKI